MFGYSRKQRLDGGFDFFDKGGKKIYVDDYVKATGANKNQLINDMAKAGDKVSQKAMSRSPLLAKPTPQFAQTPRSTPQPTQAPKPMPQFAQTPKSIPLSQQKAPSVSIVPGANSRVLPTAQPKDAFGRSVIDFGKSIISGIQQAGGSIADKALMGVTAIDDTVAAINGASAEDRAKIYNKYNRSRDFIKNSKTVTGDSFNPDKDFEFTGDAGRDAANLTGRSLQTGLDATMFVNPGRLVAGKALAAPTLKETGKFIARDAGFFGTGQGLATGAQVYGETGDLGEAAKQGLVAGGTSALAQGAMDTGGAVLGTAKTGQAAELIKSADKQILTAMTKKAPQVAKFDIEYSSLAQQLDTLPKGSPEYSALLNQMTENRAQRLGTMRNVQRRFAEGGFIAGPGARGFNAAQDSGRVFDGVDGTPRFEVDDSKSAIKSITGKKLGEVLDHDELYKNYPEAKNIDVKLAATQASSFDGKTLTLSAFDKDPKGTILHEVQHYIQNNEGFSAGGAPKSFRPDDVAAYKKLAGEAEARAVQARMNMPMSERYVKGESLYHGSPNKIEGDLRPSKHGEFGQGVYFSKDKKLASQYMTPAGEPTGTPTLTEITSAANLKKVSREEFLKDREGFYTREEKLNGGEWDGNVARRAEDKQRLQYVKEGYDGLDLADDKQVIVFPERLDSLKQKLRSTFYDSLDVPKKDLIVRKDGGTAMSIRPQDNIAGRKNTKSQEMLPPQQMTGATANGIRQDIPTLQSPEVIEQPITTRAKFDSSKNASVPDQTQSQLIGREATPRRLQKESSKKSPYSPTIDQKTPIVNEGRRAIDDGDVATYGLRDSFDENSNVPQELKESLGAFGNTRTVKSNKDLWQGAQKRVADDAAEAMDFFKSTNSDESVATGYALINRYMKQGDSKAAGNIAMDMAERALESGRQTQAYALMKRLTPEGAISYVEKKVNRYIKENPRLSDKVKWSDDTRTKLYKMAEDLNRLPEGRERNLKIGEMQQAIDNIFPSSVIDKAITVWKAGLLTSFRTHERNIIGNVINLGSERIATIPGSLADRLMSLRTGKRSLVATSKGTLSGAKYGAQIAKDQIKTGIDVTDSNLNYNINHVTWGDNRIEKGLKAYTETVFRPLGAEDKLFRESARYNSYFNQAMAEAKTKGLRGKEFDDFVLERAKNPTATMLDLAADDAGRATFSHDNVLGTLVKQGKQSLRNTKYGKFPAAVADILVPFTQVPTGVASQLYAYSPAKLVKSMYDIGKVLITGDNTLQRKAAQGFGRSVVGTAVLGAGTYLSAQGLMTGQPEDDAEKAQWQAQGKMPNSVKVGDTWYQLGSIGPQTLLILAGAQAQKDAEAGRDPILTTAGNLGKNFKDQTFLKGMSSAMDAIDDPKRYANSFVEGQVSSLVPNIVKDVAKTTDPYTRSPIGISDKLKTSIPGLSTGVPAKLDSYGQEVKNTGALELIDLFNSSKGLDVSEARYVDALRQSTGAKDHVPTIADKSIQINGETKKLTSEEYYSYQNYIGKKGKNFIGAAAKSPLFQSLSKEDQVKKIDSALQDINAAAKIELFGNAPTKVDKNVGSILQEGTTNLNRYLGGSVGDTKLSKETGAYKFLDTLPEMDETEKTTWKTQKVSQDHKGIIDAVNKSLPEGLPKFEGDTATNAVAELYAKYQKNKVDKGWSELQAKREGMKLVADAYKTQLSNNEKFISTMADKDILAAAQNGEISKAEMDNLIRVDDILVKLGITQTIGKKIRAALGYSGAYSGGKVAKGRAKGGRKGSGFTEADIAKITGQEKLETSTASSLLSLLGNTTVKKVKSQTPKSEKVALKKITVKG